MERVIKKALLLVLCFALCVCTVLLVACGGTTPAAPTQQEQSENEQSSEHTCSFVLEKAEEKYLKSSATCQNKAVYYKSCSCGKASETETFENGTLATHKYVDKVCEVCDKKQPSEGLEFDLLASGTGYAVTGIGTCTDTDLVIPETYNGLPVTNIGGEAFYDCSSLTSITIPDSVTSIGGEAFEFCDSLKSIIIPNSVTIIAGYMFYDCSSLTSITIPNSVTSIERRAFSGCSSLKSIEIPSSVTSIEEGAFGYCDSLKNVTIGNSVTNIGDSAFWECDSLENITIPDSVTSIGDEAFGNCDSLTSVTIPNSVTSIGYDVFGGCSSLEYNEYDNAYYLGNKTNKFLLLIEAKSADITGCTINENCKFIYDYAFWFCSSLTSITIPNRVTSIGEDALSGSSIESINVDKDNANYKSIDGNLYSKDGATLIQYAIGKKDTSFTIPDSVTSIEEDAFSGCGSLTSITIPNRVTSIGSSAFYGCGRLTSVTFENQNGWYVCEDSTLTSGTNLTLTDAVQNATYLTNTYFYYYWKRG